MRTRNPHMHTNLSCVPETAMCILPVKMKKNMSIKTTPFLGPRVYFYTYSDIKYSKILKMLLQTEDVIPKFLLEYLLILDVC